MAHAFQRLGRYLIEKEIASGGMATVYRAKLIGIEGFEKEVAIKKIQPFWSHKQEFVKMLIDEAKILVHLHHDNIVHVIELGKEKNAYFIVMEYVNGFDLKKIIKKLNSQKKTLDTSLACHIVKEVCRGLTFAHTRKNQNGESLNIVHRDISPQNILLGFEGEVKITDFGIAKILGKNRDTQTGVLKGKFSYMSPEQSLGQEVDQKTDIFSLGLLLYEMIFGKKCFEGENDLEILEKVKSAQVLYPPQADAFLMLILKKALCKDVNKRYQTVAEFQHDIESFENSLKKRATTQDLKSLLQQLFPKYSDAENRQFDSQESDSNVTTSFVTSYNTVIAENTVKETEKPFITYSYQPEEMPLLPKSSQKRSPFSWIVLATVLIFSYAVFYLYQKSEPDLTAARLVHHSEQTAERILTHDFLPEPKNLIARNSRVPTENSPAPQSGFVTFFAKPWAHITIKEEKLQTPATFELPGGTHEISIYYPPTGKQFQAIFEVIENESASCQILMKKSKPEVVCEKQNDQDENLKQF